MSRFLISLVAVATLAIGSAANACPADGKDAKGAEAMADCPCKRHHKSAAAVKKDAKAAPAKTEAAPAAAAPQKQTMRDLSPAPHVRMLESLSQSNLKVPEQARLDASVGVFI
jgi:hypothetical protein